MKFKFQPGDKFKIKRKSWTKDGIRVGNYTCADDCRAFPGEIGEVEIVNGNGWQGLRLMFPRGRYCSFACYYDKDDMPCMVENAVELKIEIDLDDWVKVK